MDEWTSEHVTAWVMSMENMEQKNENSEGPGSIDPKVELYNKVFAAFDENDDGKIAWKEFLKGVINGISDDETGIVIMPPLIWKPLAPEVAKEKASELFAQVSSALIYIGNKIFCTVLYCDHNLTVQSTTCIHFCTARQNLVKNF